MERRRGYVSIIHSSNAPWRIQQLMPPELTPGGRCHRIVPAGRLFAAATCPQHQTQRKWRCTPHHMRYTRFAQLSRIGRALQCRSRPSFRAGSPQGRPGSSLPGMTGLAAMLLAVLVGTACGGTIFRPAPAPALVAPPPPIATPAQRAAGMALAPTLSRPTGTPRPVDPPSTPAPGAFIYGISVSDLKNAPLVGEMGFRWMKGHISWQHSEPEPDKYNWGDLDKALSAATGQREATVRSGLDWLAARGDIRYSFDAQDGLILSGGGEANAEARDLAMRRMTILLDETAAYRAYYRRADASWLLATAAPSSLKSGKAR